MTRNRENTKLFTFAALHQMAGLRHGITTRGIVHSQEALSSLNLAYHVGDDTRNVSANRRALASAMGYDAQRLVAAQQVHGANVKMVEESDAGRGAFSWEGAIPDCDALVTNCKKLPLMIQVADCAPLLLADEYSGVFAVVHAGWRGAVAGIAGRTVRTMQENFGCEPRSIRAGIGPCLCVNCLEVGVEVAQETREKMPQCASGVREDLSAKPHLDLRALLRHDLQNAALLSTHIEAMAHCPRCENETFFSHRGQNGRAGRFALIAWRE